MLWLCRAERLLWQPPPNQYILRSFAYIISYICVFVNPQIYIPLCGALPYKGFLLSFLKFYMRELYQRTLNKLLKECRVGVTSRFRKSFGAGRFLSLVARPEKWVRQRERATQKRRLGRRFQCVIMCDSLDLTGIEKYYSTHSSSYKLPTTKGFIYLRCRFSLRQQG